jgi:hypothetical protein
MAHRYSLPRPRLTVAPGPKRNWSAVHRYGASIAIRPAISLNKERAQETRRIGHCGTIATAVPAALSQHTLPPSPV